MAIQSNPASSYEKVMKDASKGSGGGVFKLSKTYPAFLILIVTIGLSFFVRNLVQKTIENNNKSAYDKAVTSVMTRLNQGYDTKLQIINSMRNLFQRTYVVRDIFELNASVPVSTYSSIICINYVYNTPHSKLEEFIYGAKTQGYYDIKITPEGKRDDYYIVEYLYPYEKNMQRSGYDFGADAISRANINESKDNNLIVASHFSNIRKDTLGFFILAPTYKRDAILNNIEDRKNNFVALIIMEVNSEKFFKEALGKGIATDSTIQFAIVDKNESDKESVIFKSKNCEDNILKSDIKSGQNPNNPLISEDHPFKLANRTLTIHFATVSNFGGEWWQVQLHNLAFAGALLTSFVLFGFILSVITSRARALDLAERITRDQRRIVDSSQDIIAMLDFDGLWKTMNPASLKLFNLSPDELIGNSIDSLFNDEEGKNYFYSLKNNEQQEFTERVDLQMKSSDGTVKWINWSFTVSKQDKLIYSIGRDVTLEKLAEEQAKLRNKQIMLAEQFAREASESKTYFMVKLGHQLRNSLTGIVGYLQLVSGKMYETEEELDSFIGLAEESTDELFTFVSDLVDRSLQSDAQNSIDISTIQFDQVVDEANKKMVEYITSGVKVSVEINNESGKPARLVADKHILSEAIVKVYDALSSGMKECHFTISVQENPYEGATEIQILSSSNALVEELIKIYKDNKNHIIDALKYDKRDIMLDLAIVESNIRRMNGSMNVDSIGEDGNIVMLTMPLNKPQEFHS